MTYRSTQKHDARVAPFLKMSDEELQSTIEQGNESRETPGLESAHNKAGASPKVLAKTAEEGCSTTWAPDYDQSRWSLRTMPTLKLKIDVSGTVGDDVWRRLRHFDQEKSASFEYRSVNGESCNHPANARHAKGEFIVAKIRVDTPLLAQYAVAHYLEQERVVDADVEE